MSYREEDIMHETGDYWVLDNRKQGCYEVLQSGSTHSVVLQAFARTPDGLSLAKKYADYKADHPTPFYKAAYG